MPPSICRRLAVAVLVGCATLSSAVAAGPIEQIDVYKSGEEGYNTYRIPSIVRAKNGDLLAFCEGRKVDGGDAGNIDLLLKRSSDGGRTWTPMQMLWDDGDNTCGNPCAVVDQSTGTVWLLSTHNIGSDKAAALVHQTIRSSRTVWILQSRDHGKTWSEPREITSTTKDPSWTWYATGPGVGIQIQSGAHAGRLVIPCDYNFPAADGEKKGTGSHVIYSDDHGATWGIGGTIRPAMNECQVAEVPDGRGTLLMDMRSYLGHSCRAEATSADGGLSWSPIVEIPALIEPVCQASLLRWSTGSEADPGWLLFSNPASPHKRIKLTVRVSLNDGKTWDRSLQLTEEASAYSCLVQIDQDFAGCLYENGPKRPYERLTLARFKPAEIQP